MRKIILSLLLMGCCGQFMACNTASPENTFGIAILNCNLIYGFANTGMDRELESPSVKLDKNSKEGFTTMKRKEVVDSKIEFIETNLGKLKGLKETDDNRDMLQASLALYNYVLPVYKNEYVQLAKLYDESADPQEIANFAQSIHDKHYPQYEMLFEKLTAAGKPYAEKHNIKVNWNVSTSPW